MDDHVADIIKTPVEAFSDVSSAKPRKVLIKSFGCQMNVYDSQRMADVFAAKGISETSILDEADIVVLNTCHIREKAVEKVYSDLGRLRSNGSPGHKRPQVVVAGCVAQAEGVEIQRRALNVDVVVGPQGYADLPALLDKARSKKVVSADFHAQEKFTALPAPTDHAIRSRGVSAFVTVQEGCDKFCTFCVVPYTRGAEFSRPAHDILRDIQHLAASGVREVTLIGQNVNAYHGQGPEGHEWDLARLMQAVADIHGIARIRYMTSHPQDMPDSLIAAHRDLPQLMPYLHLPVQSGSDRILKQMNRKHTADDYRRLIDKMRNSRVDMALSSDFIVGFPGETDADFRDTIRLIQDIAYAGSYSFKYSPRPGTPAAEREDQVPEAIKAERLTELQNVLNTQQQDFNRATVGRTVEILLERPGRKPGQMVGKTPYLQALHIDNPGNVLRPGELVAVMVTGMGTFSLSGTLINPHIE